MLKEELRLRYSELRRGLPSESVEDYSISIANQLLALPIWGLDYYHLYLSIKEKQEVNTQYILSVLFGKDKHVVAPRVNGPDSFRNFLITDRTRFVTNKWGIPEPSNGLEVPDSMIDLVFVPLLAFDSSGHRVGYGGGYYDRFLGSCKKEVIKVGLSFFEASPCITDTREEDILLNYCVCPNRVYAF